MGKTELTLGTNAFSMVPKKIVTLVWTAIPALWLFGGVFKLGSLGLGPVPGIALLVGVWFLNSWLWKKGYYDWL
jgi:hypothetical protein